MDQASLVREKIDIVSLISEYLPLKKMGRNFTTVCPFHNENTPSFVVSPERQIWHCFGCFPPGEKIKTPFGYHDIEEIDQNHWVVSGKGNIRKVTAVMQHQYKGDLVSVKIRKLGGEVRLTTDHSVFAVRGAPYTQKQYKNFSRRYNKYLKIRKVDKAKYERLINKYFPIKEFPAGELQKGDLLLYPINRTVFDLKTIDLSKYIGKHTNYGPVPRKIPLQVSVDDNFLKLLGYYIAEGSNHRAYIRFSLGNQEKEFASDIVDLIQRLFGIEAKIHRRSTGMKTGLEITACHAKLANIFENLCGKGAANKHIPFIFQELPPEKQQVILEAIHRGDGTTFVANRSKNIHKSITTVSKVLSEQIVDILLRLHLFPTLHVEKARIDKLKVSHKEAYLIFWSDEAIQKYNAIYYTSDSTEYWLLPILKLKREKYEGPVYNFTVNEDHSYIANNFAVANCNKGGDVFTFLMEYENLEFIEALRILAKKAGVALKTGGSSFDSSKKEGIYSLNNLAAEYYNYVLSKHSAGKKALEYLIKERGLSEKLIKTFNIGFAPSGGEDLSRFLISKKKYSNLSLVEAGIGIQKGTRVIDFFRGRIIFPLIDHRGNIVGFSGRNIGDKDFGPKYINTRDTLVYHKGSMFFGLNQAKEEIKKEGYSIVMEGEFDVISAFKEGIKNTVALKGTALTENQALLLSRFAPKTALCLDQDSAGIEAIKRSIPVLEKRGLMITVIVTKEKDPDEALKNNPGEFKKSLKNQEEVYDFLINKSLKENNSTQASGKKKITDEILPLINAIQNEIVKEHYLKKLSERIDTSYESLIRQLEKKEDEKTERVPGNLQKTNRREMLEDYLLSLIIQGVNPRDLFTKSKDILAEYKFEIPSIGKIFSELLIMFGKYDKFDIKFLSSHLTKELLPTFDKCFLAPLPKFEDSIKFEEEIIRVSKDLRIFYLKDRIREISKDFKEKENKDAEIESLKDEISSITSQIASYQI